MIQHHVMTYHHDQTLLEGYYAFDDISHATQPIILVVHDWAGRRDFTCQQAVALATLGYVGFAVDLYGKGRVGGTKEENKALMEPFINDRSLLQARLLAAIAAIDQINDQSVTQADKTRIGAIGFCFGGLGVLDLARIGADLKGVVSFHGLLHPPAKKLIQGDGTIKAKILALHGREDPMVSMQEVINFSDEMTRANADWQLHLYGHTKHAFTNPEANDPNFGIVYHALSAKRSWIAMQAFFKEIFP